MSARMVSGLLAQGALVGASPVAAADAVTVAGSRGMACQIRSLRGEVIATTQGASSALMVTDAPGYRTRAIEGTAWRTYTLEANGYSITTAATLGERAERNRHTPPAAGLPTPVTPGGGAL